MMIHTTQRAGSGSLQVLRMTACGMSVSCQVVNEVIEEPMEPTEEITVFFTPRVSLAKEEQTTASGAKFSLDCMVEANPANLSLVSGLPAAGGRQVSTGVHSPGHP